MRAVYAAALALSVGCAPAHPTRAGRSAAGPGANPAPSATPQSAASHRAAASPSATPEAETSQPDDSSDLDAMLAELDAEDAPPIRQVPGCLDLRGADGCTGVGKVMLVCTALGNVLTEAPTRRLVGCLEARSGTPALCETKVLEDCALSTVDQTPSTERTQASCRQLLSHCDVEAAYREYLTQPRCASGLAALRPAARDDFVACMSRRCDLRLCVSGLL